MKITNTINTFKKHSSAIILSVLLLILLLDRAIPFLLHGPFGFGYDTGIYKYIFEHITSFQEALKSELYPIPALLAYLTNLLGLPSSIILYYAYILFGVVIAIPLYVLTKHHFGKTAGLIAVALFTVSHVQSVASQIYLFKAELGAVFMLFAFHYYSKRSYKFYIFTILLVLTQLPQLLILGVAVGISTLVNIKKEFKYHLWLIISAVIGFLFLLILTPQHITNGFNFVKEAMFGEARVDSLQIGYLMKISEFLKKEIIIILLAVAGLAISVKNAFQNSLKKASDSIEESSLTALLPLYIGIIFLSIVVFGKLFFERRYIMELDLLIIPFAAYALAGAYEWVVKEFEFEEDITSTRNSKLTNGFKIGCTIIILIVPVAFGIYRFSVSESSLIPSEQRALKFIFEQTDSKYAMVTNGMIAPWVYGFSGKETLAPGIFTSAMDYEQFKAYHASEAEQKVSILQDIANKYGDYYLLVGASQRKEQTALSSIATTVDEEEGDDKTNGGSVERSSSASTSSSKSYSTFQRVYRGYHVTVYKVLAE